MLFIKNPRIMNDSILSRLRNETAEAHASLEAMAQIESCMTDEAKYRDLLGQFYGYYAPMETILEERLNGDGEALGLADRRKAAWIASDLDILGLDAKTVAISADLPDLKEIGHAYGALYVLEGSTLGGRTISKMMENTSIPETARRFFNGYEGDTGKKWKEFCAALEQYVATHGQADEVVAGAIDTFAGMERWMKKMA